MVCKKCGTECDGSTRFCMTCGADLSQQAQSQQASFQQPLYQPPFPQPPVALPGKGFAVASLVLGIVSFFCFAIITGILAIVFGCVAKSKGFTGGMATAGIVCGVIGVALWLLTIIFLPELIFGLAGSLV